MIPIAYCLQHMTPPAMFCISPCPPGRTPPHPHAHPDMRAPPPAAADLRRRSYPDIPGCLPGVLAAGEGAHRSGCVPGPRALQPFEVPCDGLSTAGGRGWTGRTHAHASTHRPAAHSRPLCRSRSRLRRACVVVLMVRLARLVAMCMHTCALNNRESRVWGGVVLPRWWIHHTLPMASSFLSCIAHFWRMGCLPQPSQRHATTPHFGQAALCARLPRCSY
jgi:hypothetical protein